MSGISEVQSPHWLMTSLYGCMRGGIVKSLIHPLQVVKLGQQSDPLAQTARGVTKALLQRGGVPAFYRGLQPELVKIVFKEAWVWPVITLVPKLMPHAMSPEGKKLVTGSVFATIDAAVVTPLEKAKIRLAIGQLKRFSIIKAYKQGWEGFGLYWSKRCLNMTTFLVMQSHLRRYWRQDSEPLALWQLSGIGVLTGGVISILSAPLDQLNTLKQAGKTIRWRQLSLLSLYRGSPMNIVAVIINNIASILLMEWLRLP